MNMKIVLASGSPRREELMRMLGFRDFEVHPAKGEEHPPLGKKPEEIVCALASAKAEEVAALYGSDTLVIAADTIVWLDGRLLGKPHSENEAREMLGMLSGREHEVFTGLSLIWQGIETCGAERTLVRFRSLSSEEIDRYIADREPMDKAGAYGAQGKGALFTERIEGDFYNVMGLPVCRLGKMLAERGVSVL